MVDDKPLPAIPSQTSLSVAARQHRSKLIRHFLLEVHDSGLEHRLEEWVTVIEDALDEMGETVARAEHLSGFRKSRKPHRAAKCSDGRGQDAMGDIEPRKPSTAKKAIDLSIETSQEVEDIVESSSRDMERTQRDKTRRKHLLLCVAPQVHVPSEDGGFDIVPANIGCSFIPEMFKVRETSVSTILYGEKDPAALSNEGSVTSGVVGGSFIFKGVCSASQHQHLIRVMKILVYVQLSLIIEQHLYLDSHTPLAFPRPSLSSPSPSVPTQTLERNRTTHRKRTSFIPSGIFSFFTKHSIQRSSTISHMIGECSPSSANKASSHSPFDIGISRLRRISLLGERKPSLPSSKTDDSQARMSFTETLKKIENNRRVLSTSPCVSFPSPTLLVELAQAEENSRPFLLSGDKRAGLSSLLGWSARDSIGIGMFGLTGFLLHQTFSALVTRFVPSDPDTVMESEASSLSNASVSTFSSSSMDPPIVVAKPPMSRPCGRPTWTTYRYYSRDPEEDITISEAIWDFVKSSQALCETPKCHLPCGRHETHFSHFNVRIAVSVSQSSDHAEGENVLKAEQIAMWSSCKVCHLKSKQNEMTDGTYLVSFGKFLELLVYSPLLVMLKPALCEHTTPPPQPWPNLPTTRFNIIRHFSTKSHTISFTSSAVEDVFDIRVPRLQVVRGTGNRPSRTMEGIVDSSEPEEKKILQREIKRWWEGIADHMDKMENVLASDNEKLILKALPRLPSSYESYDEFTASQRTSFNLADAMYGVPTSEETDLDGRVCVPESLLFGFRENQAPLTSQTKAIREQTSAERLSSLRQIFHRAEQSLYAQLGQTPISSLNDVRRLYLATARGAEKRLYAWQKKHISAGTVPPVPEKIVAQEPEWWSRKCHALPGSNVIVREDDWGSIISYTLSSDAYQRELASMTFSRLASTTCSSTETSERPPALSLSSMPSFFSAATGYRPSSQPSSMLPDPDIDDVAWGEPEAFSSVVSRKTHPRDSGSIIKEVFRQNHSKSQTHLSAGKVGGGSLSSSPSSSTIQLRPEIPPTFSQRLSGSAPLAAWAKPDVQIIKDEVEGQVVVTPDAAEEAGRILEHEAGKMDKGETIIMNRAGSEASLCIPSSAPAKTGDEADRPNDERFNNRKYSSSSFPASMESDTTIRERLGGTAQISNTDLPPPPPPKEERDAEPGHGHFEIHQRATTGLATPDPGRSPSSFASTLTSGLSSAMKFLLHDSGPSHPTSPSPKHGLLSTDTCRNDERPHIKYDWTIGERLKFSCTVYFAKQFDTLRKRCGIENDYVKSLSRSSNWAAEGGKSRSSFWKTADEKFIIKTLVDAWNVADLQVLLEIAPSYFQYMDGTTNKATVLAKVLGFYTVEIRNLETGTMQARSDLLVMENLFYNQKITKTFDLKGIPGRKVKPESGSKVLQPSERSRTLLDKEWIEGQQKSMILVHAHAKHMLSTALRMDADLLANCNIMDYSLLVGVNEEEKELACGLVDTIGSYTFAKTIEYKAKHGLNSVKDITVMPPAEYEERFLKALEGYFVACPDKWSKPRRSRIIKDVNELPSVL